MAIFKSPLRDNTSQRQQEKKHVRFACLHMSKSHARPHTISLTKRRRQRLTHSSHFELLVINSRHNFPFLSKHSQFIISLTSHYIGTFLSESGPCWWDCKRWVPRFYRNDATVLLFYSKMPEHGYVLAVKGCARSGWILQEFLENVCGVILRITIIFLWAWTCLGILLWTRSSTGCFYLHLLDGCCFPIAFWSQNEN